MVSNRRKTESDNNFRVTPSAEKKGVLGSCSLVDGQRWGSNTINSKRGRKGCNSSISQFYSPKPRVETFTKGKTVSPVPQTSGPKDKKSDDHFDIPQFDSKGKKGSFGVYETKNFARQGTIYPWRLIYRKTWKKGKLKKVDGNEEFAKTRNKFLPAKYDLDEDGKDWLKSKHRILLYPSSSEESFMKRKLANPVPKATGPRNIGDKKLPIWSVSYDLKDRFDSLGGYETLDVDKSNTYPLRLMYPKATWKPVKSNLQTLNDRALNFENSEVCTGDESDKYIDWTDMTFTKPQYKWSDKYIDRNDMTLKKPQYKWRGMNGSLGDYEAPVNASRGTTYPIRLWYSKSKKSVVNLESDVLAKESSLDTPKLKKRHYYWKGRNGSMGDYETMRGCIFPLRMIHPKTRLTHSQLGSKTKERRKTKVQKVRAPFRSISDIFPKKTLYPTRTAKTSNLSTCKTKAENLTKWPSTTRTKSDARISMHKEKCYRWKGKRGGSRPCKTESSSLTESLQRRRLPCSETRLNPYVSHRRHNGRNCSATKNKQSLVSSPKSIQKQSELRNKNIEVSNSFIPPLSSQIMGRESKDRRSQAEPELAVQQQLSPRSSQHTVFTTWSDDDLTSKEHSVSISSNEGFGTYFQQEYINENSLHTHEDETASLPQIPMPKYEKKWQGVSMLPSEGEELITTLSERKLRNGKTEQSSKSRKKTLKPSPEVWKPAKYNIPDPVAEIKERGIFSPRGLYC